MEKIAMRPTLAAVLTVLVMTTTAIHAANQAKGTVTYRTKSAPIIVTLAHAYLVKGPDVVSGKTIRRIVLSKADVGPKIQACDTMMCAVDLDDAITLDFDGDPFLPYWFVADGQRVQRSGATARASVTLTVDTPQRMAGKWTLDLADLKVDAEFDATLIKDFSGQPATASKAPDVPVAVDSAITQVAVAFLKAAHAGDVAAMKEFVTPDGVKKLESPDGKLMVELMKVTAPANPNITSVEMQGMDAATAKIEAQQSSREGSPKSTITVKLVKIGGQWKVNPSR